ncbi:Uncharacterised protein [Mycobacteroides abscessus subsp. abscessus]|nr:Uncharacterised protein [Mycobacteroides abscessus subsp. abscessus]SKV95942.1 Uncharacterised protein [Mycobacteroides abscessus subsp. abscessus]
MLCGCRRGSLRLTAPGMGSGAGHSLRGSSVRSFEGVVAKTAAIVSLNCRMLEKPAAKAISDIGRSVR